MKPKKWFVEINESENEIHVFRDGSDLCHYLKNNDPVMAGTVVLNPKDAVSVSRHFKDRDVAFVGVRWNKYADQLGLDPV